MTQYYLDTSIWIDFYEKRGHNGELAFQFLSKVLRGNNSIFYSDLVIVELKRVGYTQEQVLDIFRIAKPYFLRRLHIYPEQIDEARLLMQSRNIPKGDALHAILARDNNTILISRDNDFKKLKDITKVHFPEDFI